uniref:Uncharacterized protein n=1 Tax=Kalanchoe fedtschenkoi TaxID=63787 RepID=A0A7N0UI42_KALFE
MSIESAAEEGTPFLRDEHKEETDEKNMIQQTISQTFESTAHLANLLPTGTVIAFKLLSPILSTGGDCDPATRFMTMLLVVICAVSCFLQCFTDSFRDKDGNVCYGFATVHGLWVIDGSTTLPPAVAGQYRLHFIDFVHAFASVLVFAAIALFDRNVVNCFYPSPSKEANEVLTGLPIMIGVMCSMVFVKFPSKRRGIGFPVSPDNVAQR